MNGHNLYITAILPAHNEAKSITKAIESIRSYVNYIIVACDNCSDNTMEVAKRAGADEVFNTRNNHHRKAGALNQALFLHVPWHIPNLYILIMDADTQVINPPVWFKKAKSLIYPSRPKVSQAVRNLTPYQLWKLKWFNNKKYHKLLDGKAYDCVGSIFKAPKHLPKHNFIEEGQRLEWIGYRNKIERSRVVFVLTGTCSLISAQLLKRVLKLYHYQQFYNDKSITEDFCMTIDLKECHARMISPSCCLCATATKPNTKSLIAQRKRWYLGALDLVNSHKPDEVMFIYICQQIMLFISVFAFMLLIGVSIYLYLVGSVTLTAFWTIVFIGFDIDEVAKIWKYSRFFDKIYAISIIGCLVYAFILDLAYLAALESSIDNKKVYWNTKSQH